MKKILLSLALALSVVFVATAQEEVDLTQPATTVRLPKDFTLGKWYDAKWDATWEFNGDGINLYKGDEKIQSFTSNVKDYTCKAGVNGLVINFSCDETKRTYTITKPIALSTDLELNVVRHDVPNSDPNKNWKTTIKRK